MNSALPQNAYERRVLEYLTRYPDAKDAHFINGGKHRRLKFVAHEKSVTLTINSHEGEAGGNPLDLQDVRRAMGGPPPCKEEPARKTLEELTAEAEGRCPLVTPPPPVADIETTETPRWKGGVALYVGSLVLSVDAHAVIAAFGDDAMATACDVLRVTDDLYIVRRNPNSKRRFFSSDGVGKLKLNIGSRPFLAAGETGFRRTPAEVTVRGGVLRFQITEPLRSAPARVPPTASGAASTPDAPAPLELRRQDYAAPKIEEVVEHALRPVIDEAFLRETLAAVKRVEAETPYRLTRVKGTDGEPPRWAFVAPRIE